MKKILNIFLAMLILILATSCASKKALPDGGQDTSENDTNNDTDKNKEENKDNDKGDSEPIHIPQFASGSLDSVYTALKKGNFTVTFYADNNPPGLDDTNPLYYKFDFIVSNSNYCGGYCVTNNDSSGLTYFDQFKQYMKIDGTWQYLYNNYTTTGAGAIDFTKHMMLLISICNASGDSYTVDSWGLGKELHGQYWEKMFDEENKKYYYLNEGKNKLVIDDDTVTITFDQNDKKSPQALKTNGIYNIYKIEFTNINHTIIAGLDGIEEAEVATL